MALSRHERVIFLNADATPQGPDWLGPLVAALADPGIVCELHLGLAQGVADTLDGIVVDDLIPRDPRKANCRLRCHLTPAEQA